MINKYIPKNNFRKIDDIEAKLMVGKETNDNIYISFFVPTYDRLDTLIEAINSITNLKELDTIEYEIIVVDNSANFTESNKIHQYFRKAEIRNLRYYINTENVGLYNNWNRGAQLSKGRYIAYLHDDDLLNENYLIGIKKCIDVGEKRGKLGFIHTKKTTFSHVCSLPRVQFKNKGGMYEFTSLYPVINGVGSTCAPTCGTIFLKKALIDTGGFDDELWPASDQIIGDIIISNGYKGYISEDSLGYYRVAMNATINPKTIMKMIEMDFKISSEYYYQKNMFSKIFGLVFKNAQYSHRIDVWMNNAKSKYRVSVTLNDLDFRNKYVKNSFSRFSLKVLMELYTLYFSTKYICERGKKK